MRKRLLALLAAPLLGGAFLTATATPAQAACVSEYSIVSAHVDIPLSSDGTYQIATQYRDCGSVDYVDKIRITITSGPLRNPYNTRVTVKSSGGVNRWSWIGTWPSGVWSNIGGVYCPETCVVTAYGTADTIGAVDVAWGPVADILN